ncbi:MAG: hypothetical protein AB7E47_01250 [Desulfovibrionaceae bacterium]
MLHFREAQKALFREMQEGVFVGELAARLRRYWPGPCADLGDEGVRRRIGLGMERAQHYGMVTSYNISRYVYCMMELGDDFDTDPACAFAGEILRDERYDPTTRMDRLIEAASRVVNARAQAPGNDG